MKEKILLPFISPTTICVVGPTQSGKTMFTKKLIENVNEMFTDPPEKILYVYLEYQKLFDEMQTISNLILHEGLPDKQKIDEFTKDTKSSLIILDDVITQVVNCPEKLSLFTVTSHHRGCSLLVISQNLYCPGKYAKSISLNCANFVLFRNSRDMRQLSTFASQILPGMTKYFMDSFSKAINRKKYSYLLVDLSPHREDNSFKSLPIKCSFESLPIMAKELILLSKRQFEDISKGLEEKNADIVETKQTEGAYSENSKEEEKEKSKRHLSDISTQTGNGLIFSQKKRNMNTGPPGIPAKKTKKANIKWLTY
ncbi:unnamed protein product [Mytilus coruscus]|uniref:AAA domain-containing protein n=1 Tax=Mytilus coruscus TaxID=42192 RepID=A0A6J8A271_MYTCO|nr:unnamed protein product [Mytilus coruscus]